jgi:hypothetical protein
VKSVVVHISKGNVNRYGGDIVKRAVAFNDKRGLKCVPEAVFAELSAQMCMEAPHTLCLACVDDEEKVRGHAISHINELYGYRTAMVYHLEIDEDARDDTRMAMLMQGWEQIEEWARVNGCKAIRTWAMNEKLAEIFSRYGFEAQSHVLMEKELK